MLLFDFTDKTNELDLTYDEKNEFVDVCSSSTTQILCNSKEKGIDSFWLSLTSEYSIIIAFIKYVFKYFVSNRETM